jgi:hypothetical protein
MADTHQELRLYPLGRAHLWNLDRRFSRRQPRYLFLQSIPRFASERDRRRPRELQSAFSFSAEIGARLAFIVIVGPEQDQFAFRGCIVNYATQKVLKRDASGPSFQSKT